MILVDYQIDELCRNAGLVDPYDSNLVNPASLDLRVGSFLGYLEEGEWHSVNIEDMPYVVSPGMALLVGSLETINLPEDVAAQFQLKSSRARELWGHTMSGWCDPGWHGSKLTIELHNLSPEPLEIYTGLKIGQLVFHKLENPPKRSYAVTGRYNGDPQFQPSRG